MAHSQQMQKNARTTAVSNNCNSGRPSVFSEVVIQELIGPLDYEPYALAVGVRDHEPRALLEAACCFLTGNLVLPNISRANELIGQSIRAGSVDAKALLGSLLVDSPTDFGRKPPIRSIKLLKDAAESGHVAAQVEFFRIVTQLGLDEYRPSAVKFLSQAARSNNSDALFEKGVLLTEDDSDETNRSHALKLFRAAAESGHADAAFNAGLIYVSARRGIRNYRLARTMFERAAAQGHAKAQYELGLLWDSPETLRRSGIEATSRDRFIRAAKYYRESACNGFALGQVNWGVCCVNGDGTRKQFRKAVSMYALASLQGEPLGCQKLSQCLADGVGLASNMEQSLRWGEYAAILERQRDKVNGS